MATITYSGTSSGSQDLTAGSLSFTTAGTWTLNTDSDIVTTVYLWGGGGGNHNRTGYSYGSGGAGGYTKGNITLLANSTYNLVVGGGGHGDGQTQSNATGGGGKGGATGANKAGGGGGYTGLFLTSITQANAKAIAGGGGGYYGGGGGSESGPGPGGGGSGYTGGLTSASMTNGSNGSDTLISSPNPDSTRPNTTAGSPGATLGATGYPGAFKFVYVSSTPIGKTRTAPQALKRAAVF
jgi:hypothetical protein